MPPTLALTIAIAFAAWLLYQDVKRRPSVSGATWIPLCALFVLGSRPLSAWLESGVIVAGSTSGDAEGRPIDQFFYVVLFLASGIVAVARNVQWSRLLSENRPMMTMYAFFALSILWSDNPAGSFTRWAKDAGLLVVISIFLSEKDRLESMRAVYFRAACIFLPLSIVLIRYYPELGRAYHVTGEMLLTGLAQQKNGLGQSVMTLCLFVAWDYTHTSKRRAAWQKIILMLMGAWLLYISDSQTAVVCAVLGSALIVRPYWLASSKLINVLVLTSVITFVIILPIQSQLGWLIRPISELVGRDATFTGRDETWKAIVDHRAAPFLGAGFSNFWGTKAAIEIRSSLQTPIVTAHNSYLDIYLDGGLVGLVLLLATFLNATLSLCARMSRQKDYVAEYSRIRFALLITAMTYGLTETVFARPSILWFTALLALTEYPLQLPTVPNGGSRAWRSRSWRESGMNMTVTKKLPNLPGTNALALLLTRSYRRVF